jgi:MFS family permease
MAARERFGASAEAWALIAALPLAHTSNLALVTVVGPMRDDLAIGYSELGFVLACFGIARLMMDIPAGGIVQRLNARRATLVSLLLTVLGAALGMLAVTSWQVGLVRLLHGGSSAVIQAAALVWLVGVSRPERRGRVMALSEAVYSLVALLVPPLVGVLAAQYSWRSAYALSVVAALLALVGVLGWTSTESAVRSTGGTHGGTAHEGRAQSWLDLRVGGALLLTAYIVGFLVFFCRQAVVSTLVPLLGSEQIGLSPALVGLALGLLSLVSIGAILAGGWLGDHLGRVQVAIPGMLILLLSLLGLFLVSGEVSYFAVSALLGLGFLVNFLPVALIGDAVPANLRARGIAGYRLLADSGVLLGPLAIGIALDAGGYPLAQAIPPLACVVALVAVWVLMRPRLLSSGRTHTPPGGAAATASRSE